MLQERIEGKWLACFRRVFTLNGIGRGTRVAIVSETQSRPVLVQLADLACHDLGADYCMITMPTPRQTAPVPVKSTGTSLAIQGMETRLERVPIAANLRSRSSEAGPSAGCVKVRPSSSSCNSTPKPVN